LDKLKKQLTKIPGARILDIATGKGSFIEMIMQLSDTYSEIIGIDSSSKAIEMANNSISDSKVTFAKMDINKMTFEQNSFDIVCLSNSMHHMGDINDCIDKMIKMVKPDGIILFNEMISDNKDEKQNTHTYMHHFWAEIDRLKDVVHKETMERQEILDVFNNHPNVLIDQTWDLEFGEEQELTKETYDWLKNTLDRSLDRIKDHPDYKLFEKRAQQLKKRLDTVGFRAATQIILVAK